MTRYGNSSGVSVVTASYNSSRFVIETIKSVAAQTIKPAVHIIVDDASSDDSVSVLKEAEKRFSNIKIVIHDRNLGYPAALNTGIASAQSDLVGILDSDDLAAPNWLETVIPIITKDPEVGSAGGGCSTMSEDGIDTGHFFQWTDRGDVTALAQQGRYPFLNGGAIHRKSALDRIGGYNSCIKSAEDMDLFLSLSYVSKLINVGRPLIQYRKRRLSESRKTPEYNAAIADFLKAKGSLLKSGKSVTEANRILDEKIKSLARMDRIRKLAPHEYDFEMANSFEVGKHYWHALRYYFIALRSGHSPSVALRGVFRCLRDAGLKWSNRFQANRPSFR